MSSHYTEEEAKQKRNPLAFQITLHNITPLSLTIILSKISTVNLFYKNIDVAFQILYNIYIKLYLSYLEVNYGSGT